MYRGRDAGLKETDGNSRFFFKMDGTGGVPSFEIGQFPLNPVDLAENSAENSDLVMTDFFSPAKFVNTRGTCVSLRRVQCVGLPAFE
jgi:hypothetical protein